MWTSSMISADSNTPSDVAFYRRASWLEEYAMHRVRSMEDRSEARKREAAASRRSFSTFLTACLPCSSPSKPLPKHRKSVAFSSQTSLTSMLEVIQSRNNNKLKIFRKRMKKIKDWDKLEEMSQLEIGHNNV